MVFSPETFIAAFTGGPEKRPKTDDSHVPTLEELQERKLLPFFFLIT